jgi:hypothetical protein
MKPIRAIVSFLACALYAIGYAFMWASQALDEAVEVRP